MLQRREPVAKTVVGRLGRRQVRDWINGYVCRLGTRWHGRTQSEVRTGDSEQKTVALTLLGAGVGLNE
ncbi:hypothetical protein BRD14_02995 [Halobacteriales archaeon SW_5_68_122]|nr:MAG: hypothetical protein BRD14_02995 [Halobacteriales archaeon SW_5_68_122]